MKQIPFYLTVSGSLKRLLEHTHYEYCGPACTTCLNVINVPDDAEIRPDGNMVRIVMLPEDPNSVDFVFSDSYRVETVAEARRRILEKQHKRRLLWLAKQAEGGKK